MFRRLRGVFAGCIAASLCCWAAGCESPPSPERNVPTLQTVKGRVLDAGGEPLTGGHIMFRCDEDAQWLITGVIEADGRFTLQTRFEDVDWPGAVAGTHAVTIIPPTPQEGVAQHVSLPVVLPEKVIVRSGLNDLELRLPEDP
jgi:hypothetical protein